MYQKFNIPFRVDGYIREFVLSASDLGEAIKITTIQLNREYGIDNWRFTKEFKKQFYKKSNHLTKDISCD